MNTLTPEQSSTPRLPDWEQAILNKYTLEAATPDSGELLTTPAAINGAKEAARALYMRRNKSRHGQDHGTRGPWKNRRWKDPHWPEMSMPHRKLIGQITPVDLKELPEAHDAATIDDPSHWVDVEPEDSLWEMFDTTEVETPVDDENEEVDPYHKLASQEAGRSGDFEAEFSGILRARSLERVTHDAYDGDPNDHETADWLDGFHITDKP